MNFELILINFLKYFQPTPNHFSSKQLRTSHVLKYSNAAAKLGSFDEELQLFAKIQK
jgi:hypothetical protein